MMSVLSFCDTPVVWQIGFQDPATVLVEGMQDFHNYLIFYCIIIGFFVCSLLFYISKKFNSDNFKKSLKFTHCSELEIIWTLIPVVVLFFIAMPSFVLLYSLDDSGISPSLTVKIIGHQWYWSYEYSDFSTTYAHESYLLKDRTIAFDSYMLPEEDLIKGSYRLLEVDNRICLPSKTHIRLLITSDDVLHNWCVPSFGIKVDACPGRLSQASLFIKRDGLYFGQCSEICGVNHGFMPIVAKVIDANLFLGWVYEKQLEAAGIFPKIKYDYVS